MPTFHPSPKTPSLIITIFCYLGFDQYIILNQVLLVAATILKNGVKKAGRSLRAVHLTQEALQSDDVLGRGTSRELRVDIDTTYTCFV